jgi:hypothetical protein
MQATHAQHRNDVVSHNDWSGVHNILAIIFHFVVITKQEQTAIQHRTNEQPF